MKGLPSKWNAAVALSLFMAAWLPASAAWASCETLEAAASDYESGSIDENPLKPTDVDVGTNASGMRFEVYWENPSNRPANTITGFCVHITHTDSGNSIEDCVDNSGTYSSISCTLLQYCPGNGAFDTKVKLKNNCNLTDEYSDSVSWEYTPPPPPSIWQIY